MTKRKIKYDHRNFRKHSDEKKAMIRKSLEELGAGRSVVVDADDELIAGNGVYEQAEALGLGVKVVETDGSELVVVKRTDLHTEDEKRKRLAFADNATSDRVEWDFDALKMEIDADTLAGFNVKIPDIEVNGNRGGQNVDEDDFDENTDEVSAICQRGEIYQLGNHRLMCGDSTDENDVQKLMGGEKADLIVTDPPYGVSYTEKNEYLNSIGPSKHLICTKAIENDSKTPEEMYEFWFKVFGNLHANTTNEAAYYITAPQGGDLLLRLLQSVRDSGFKLRHILCWNKDNHVLGRCDYNYKHEPIVYGWKQKGTHHFYGAGKFKTSVWDIPKPLKNELHPTMKPIELIAECLLDCSIEGQSVLDLFGGSGTTLIACEQLNRNCRMMELDPHYCDVIIARWEKLTGKKAVKL